MIEHSRRWLRLAALIPALAMIFIDITILPVALPTIQKQLGASNVELEWTVNAYLLVMAVLLLIGGKLGDKIGHRRSFSIGCLIFTISSGLCGFASSCLWMILARALQGVGAAMMTPSSNVLLMSLFPPHERGRATGINVSVSSLFMLIGPLLGGYITEVFSWRWIFFINVPVGLVGTFLILFLIPKSEKRAFLKIDLIGFFYFLVSTSLFVLIVMEGRDWGWGSPLILTLLTISILSGSLFILREKKIIHPFIDRSLFRHPIFKAVNITLFSIQFILMITMYRAIFFQNDLGWSPIKMGVVTVVTTCPILFMSLIGGYLSDHFGPKIPLAIGFSLTVVSFFWVPLFLQSSLGILLIGFFCLGFGVPLIFTPSYTAAMNIVPKEKSGMAFGTISTIRSLGSCIGVAAIGALIDNLRLSKFQDLADQDALTQGISDTVLKQISLGSAASNDVLSEMPKSLAQLLSTQLNQAQVFSFQACHYTLGFVILVSFIWVLFLYRKKFQMD
jgi:EmrB/QacA subfamily drug resistance transporter